MFGRCWVGVLGLLWAVYCVGHSKTKSYVQHSSYSSGSSVQLVCMADFSVCVFLKCFIYSGLRCARAFNGGGAIGFAIQCIACLPTRQWVLDSPWQRRVQVGKWRLVCVWLSYGQCSEIWPKIANPLAPPPQNQKGALKCAFLCFHPDGAGDEIRTHDPNLGKVMLYP